MRSLLVSTAAILLATALPGQVVKTILNAGPTNNRYDMVILGDGYTDNEQASFDADALRVSAALFQKEPYKTFAGYFNVHTVFRASMESGANHPDENPPVVRNTAYGASYNTGGTPRCLYIANTSLALRDASLAPAVEGRIIVLVNDSRYGGCAGTFSVSYNGTSMTEVQVHELGHSFGDLADEYVIFEDTYIGPEPRQKNVSTLATGDKWSKWLGYNGIDAYEGARYYSHGLFRPQVDCLMRSLGESNCAVCREQLVLKAYQYVVPIEQPIPATTSVVLTRSSTQVFSFRNLVPASNNASIVWRVDGVVQPGGTTSFALDAAPLAVGSHTVEVEVRDETSMVRLDPQDLLTNRYQWSISVVDTGLPDLVVEFVQGDAGVRAGQTMSITTVVRNAGQSGGAGDFTLEHFLSTDSELSEDDIYLGSSTVSGLAAGESRTVVRTDVRVPIQANTRVWYLWAQVDRNEQLAENREDNNQAHGFVFVAFPGCGPYLEYRDPLLYPHNSSTVGILSGGVTLPTVIAPCAAPGTSYVVVWGCSGTYPGTVLSNGLTVPINSDQWTTLGLLNVNDPVFGSFHGTIDEFGRGNATFTVPPGLPVNGLEGHFAAVLLNGAGTFLSTSNPVEIFIRL